MGHYAKGGESSKSEYMDFIKNVTEGIGDKSPIIIYEPDALPQSFQMTYENKQKRIRLIREALKFLYKESNAKVYLDVGHPYWLKKDEVINFFKVMEICFMVRGIIFQKIIFN